MTAQNKRFPPYPLAHSIRRLIGKPWFFRMCFHVYPVVSTAKPRTHEGGGWIGGFVGWVGRGRSRIVAEAGLVNLKFTKQGGADAPDIQTSGGYIGY